MQKLQNFNSSTAEVYQGFNLSTDAKHLSAEDLVELHGHINNYSCTDM